MLKPIPIATDKGSKIAVSQTGALFVSKVKAIVHTTWSNEVL